MKTKTVVVAALAAVLALTTVRAADLTPADSSAVVLTKEETKAIAEEGFIYGLPIVMNYAVMYDYCVDKNSGQYKAPFNQILNEARVFTYKDTAIGKVCGRSCPEAVCSCASVLSCEILRCA